MLVVFLPLFSLQILGQKRTTKSTKEAPSQLGMVSFYADKFHGRPTSSGELFNMHGLTCAHPWAPFGTLLKITNPNNGKSVVVRVNDRGPHCKGRILDLSRAAARKLGITGDGASRLRVAFIGRDAQNHLNDSPDITPEPEMASAWIESIKTGNTYNHQGKIVNLNGYGMQIAAYHDTESALYDLNAIRKAGFHQAYLQVARQADGMGQAVYRVIMGDFTTREEALGQKELLAKAGYTAFPVNHKVAQG